MEQLDRIDRGVRAVLDLSQQIKQTLEQQCRFCPHCPSVTREDEPEMDNLLTAKEVQDMFGIVHSTYYRWIAKGWLIPMIVGGKHYYDAEEIQRLLKGRKYRARGGMEG